MLVSTPTKPFAHGNVACESSMSPKYHHHRRHISKPYDSPTLSPSPLRKRPLFPLITNIPDNDDILHSPYKSPPFAQQSNPFSTSKPQTIPLDDDEGHIFLSTAASTSSQPLLTPIKQPRRVPSRPVLPMSNLFSTPTPFVVEEASSVSRGVGVGTKRKSSTTSTPLRPHNLTPLKLVHSNKECDGIVSFDRLAPPSEPKFITKTPQTKAETEAYLKRQTATLTRLRLSDPDGIGFDCAADDSGCEDDSHVLSPSPTKAKHNGKVAQQPKPLVMDFPHTGKEVVEAVSPGGHVTKRRARSRPVSAELLEGAFRSPRRSPLKVSLYRGHKSIRLTQIH